MCHVADQPPSSSYTYHQLDCTKAAFRLQLYLYAVLYQYLLYLTRYKPIC